MIRKYASALSPEFEILAHCARLNPEPGDRDRINHLVDLDIDWSRLLTLANYHGVRPLFYRSLLATNLDAVPPEYREYLSVQAHATSALNQFLVKEAGRLIGLLAAHNVDAMVLKGPVIAHRAYGSLDLRPFIDIDLLVRGRDQAVIEALLAENQYTPFSQVARHKGIWKKLYIWQACQYPFERGGGTLNLDVHFAVMPRLYYYAPDFETLWQRGESLSIADQVLPAMDTLDLLLMLCFHGEKNRWESLKYICDVGVLIGANPDLDWDEVMRRTRRTHGERIVLLGLSLAEAFYALEFPPEVKELIRTDRYVGEMTEMFLKRLPEQIDLGIAAFPDRVRFHLLLQNTLKTKARYAFFAMLRRLSDIEL